MNIYNIALVGNAAVGKTSFVRALKDLHFEKRYIPTIGSEIHPIQISPETIVNLWDHSGQAKHKGPNRTNYINKADGIIVLYKHEKDSVVKKWGDQPNILYVSTDELSIKDDPKKCKDLVSNLVESL